MNVLLFVPGILILLFVVYDFFHTTLSFQGSGPLTTRTYRLKWKAFTAINRLFGGGPLKYGGLLVALAMLTSWILLMWLGLFLVFQSDPNAVITNNELERPADPIERIYFTGYVLSTLGLGDLKPNTGWARILTAVFSFSGFIFFTASMTYLLSVSTAILQKRTLAMIMNDMGVSPQEILLNGWNGKDFTLLKEDLMNIKQQVNKLTQSHKMFPIIHYFTTRDRRDSISINLARLDEALTIFLHVLEEKDLETQKVAEQVRKAVDNFLSMVLDEMLTEKGKPWDPPATDRLEAHGMKITNVPPHKIEERRRKFSGYIRFEGWSEKLV